MPKKSDSDSGIGGLWGLGVVRFFVVPPGLFLTIGIIAAALVWWKWWDIVSWITTVASSIWALFGWGLILLAITIIFIIGVIWRRQLSLLIRRWKLYLWNKCLGGIAFGLAIWGILALFSLGGSFGESIIGYPDFKGVLRVLGLVILGVILVALKAFFHFAAESIARLGRIKKQSASSELPKVEPKRERVSPFSWPGKRSEKRPAPIPESSAEVPPQIPEIEPEREKTSAIAPTTAQMELKQLAQETWKKYGEAPNLVTIDGWRLPPIDILDRSPEVQFSQADNAKRARLIEEALASYGVEAKVAQINAGPTVTQFGVEPGWDRKLREVKEKDKDGNVRIRLEEVSKTRVKVDRINSLGNDLALALAAPSIRIEAPVPGKSIVGIEVPNTASDMVSLRGVIETSAFQKIAAKSKLTVALGKGAGGEAVAADLTKMPHLLIAGATGSGKTVCLNTIICCLLMYNTSYDARFIMIDPKRVELISFNGIPHLAAPVIVETDKALDALRWLNQEMNKRYQQLAAASARNIEGYNKGKQGERKMPYLVLIIDELADLMMAGGDEVERILCRLAQLSRAVGIHLVVATQRPSVDVVTGLIKANFPTRISFAVTSQVDSRTILDGVGAEKLLGRGDMLYMPTEAGKPKRLQGCFVSDPEIERLVFFWGNQRKEEVTSLNIEAIAPSHATNLRGDIPEDSLLEAARQLAQEHPHISASFLQRRLRIGYPRAARLMEQLEEETAEGKEN